MHTLYLCYLGVREPLVQTQVLPYLRQLREGGIAVSLLTFEPERRRTWPVEDVAEWRQSLRAQGIDWSFLPYHKRPSLPATLYDIIAGARAAARLVRRRGIDVLHARSHTAAAMGVLAKRLTGAPLVFDIRGFMPEEYVDAGVWAEGSLNHRLAKRAEARLLAAADAFVVLTERAREILFPGAGGGYDGARPVEVIPCCADLERFRAAEGLSRDELRRELGLTGRRVLVYVGALGGWYLTEETAALLAAAHRQDPRTFSLILTQSPEEKIAVPLQRFGVPESDYLIRRVAPAEIPRYLRAADLALSLIKPCFSKLASSPTKLAEYLASGLPVLCNAGIGDVDAVVEGERVGVVLREFTPEAFARALAAAESLQSEPGIGERCRSVAQKHFDLETVGGPRYRRLYRRLAEGRAGEPAAARVTA